MRVHTQIATKLNSQTFIWKMDNTVTGGPTLLNKLKPKEKAFSG